YSPTIVEMLNLDYVEWATSPYIGLVVFAIIFFILSYFIVDYIVGFLRWIDEALIKVPIIDLFFGSVGLILGLVVAYLLKISLQDVVVKFVSLILSLLITIILAYLGFQVGYRRRVELTELMSVNRKENEEEVITKRNDTVLPETSNKGTRPKILDTSVIIDG